MQVRQQQGSAPIGTPGAHPIRRVQSELGRAADFLYRRATGLWRRRPSGPVADTGTPAVRARRAVTELLQPGALVVQKGATSDSVEIWVGVVVDASAAEELAARLVVTGPGAVGRTEDVVLQWYAVDSERVSSGLPHGLRFYHAHHTVTGLRPGEVHEVRLADARLGAAAPAVARTLPERLDQERPLRVFAGSCYDFTTDPDDALDTAFRQVFGQPGPDLTLLLGDQVYADSPAWHYAFVSRHHPRTGLLAKYWRTWGMQPDPDGGERRGLRGVLTSGPTYFLPDDHEFWNNWPNRTVLAKHSYGKLVRGLRNERRRMKHALIDDADLRPVDPPFDPRIAPWNPYQQNYLPVHPAEWDAWGLAAMELFESFQTPGVLSRGEREPAPSGPPAWLDGAGPAGGRPIHEPGHPVLQVVRIDPLTIALLDTRTRRTRRLRHPELSAFVDERYLREVLAEAERAEVFVLALSQPVLQGAEWPADPEKSWLRGLLFGDTGMHHYWHQYERFWTGLLAARTGRPTVLIGGDIHQSYLAVVREHALVQVVSSPMSLVVGGNLLKVGPARGYDYSEGSEFETMARIVTGPVTAPVGSSSAVPGAAVSLGCVDKNAPGFADLSFTRLDQHEVRFDVRLFDRNAVVAGETGPAVSHSFRLVHGGGAPGVHDWDPDGTGTSG
jgi:hypothetical protein